MADFDIKNPVYNDKMRMLTTSDQGHADLFNELFGQLIVNDVAINNKYKSIVPISFADIDEIDDAVVELPDYEGDVTDSDIDDILNN